VLPSAEALPAAIPLIESLRAAGVAVVMHAAGKEAWGSMKSQFKKADASGARHALIFGADELARGEVAVKPLRDAAAPSTTTRWPTLPAWRMNCSTHNRGLFRLAPMATQLDLQEQEQLDALKAFWKTYGNLITWVLILVLGAYAAWNGWQYWQRDQGIKAGAMFDELDAPRSRATSTRPAVSLPT
jgi:hypothetical protein